MKLLSLQLCNFRQFYGKTPEIHFATTPDNITIVHGNNGSGKTALLNAFTWVLYERFSAAFSSPEQLVNKRAIYEVPPREAVECFVEIAFEHDHKRYRLKRSCRAYRSDLSIEYRRIDPCMWVAGDDGRWFLTPQHPDDIIGRILPGSLHQYFFFDGERIEHIVREDQKAKISEATRELLGIEVFNRALRHLKEAIKTLEEEFKQIGDSQTQKLLKEKQRLELDLEKLNQRQSEIQQEINDQQDIRKTLRNRLFDLSGAKEIQNQRHSLEAQQQLLRGQLKKAQETIKQNLSQKAYTTLLGELTLQCRDILETLRNQGELPSGIKQQFVKDLLHQKRCICGADLLDGTHAHQLVYNWMDKAGSSDLEESTIHLKGQLDGFDQQAKRFWETVDQEQYNISQWRLELSQVETKIDNLKSRLREFPVEDIQQLQKRLDEVESRLSELERETGANQQKIYSIEMELALKVKQIAKYQLNEEKQAVIQRRLLAGQDAINRIAEVKSRLETQFRVSLEARVQGIFSQISFTPYIPRLNEKYELCLMEANTLFDLPIAASTGENQILCLSFIGGIIDRVREWSQSKMHLGPDSSTFPIVMDSPFGSLDEIYRRQVAKSLPKIANQLIVLVSKTQWRGEVETEMDAKIGKEYVLVYHTPKLDGELDEIHRRGNVYPLVKLSANEFEFTEIIEVNQ